MSAIPPGSYSFCSFYIKRFRGNHKLVFKTAGFTSINEYKYYDTVNNRGDIEQLLADLSAAPEKWVILFLLL